MYYPKSQIVTNLYTNGQEYVIKSTSENYIGNYWKTSDGKFFTGKTPEDKNIQELIVATSAISLQYSNLTSEAFELKTTSVYLNNSDIITGEYNRLNDTLLNVNLLPTSYNPQPTQDDYALGEFTRYFCKKTNELRYIEINKDTYEKLTGQDSTYLWQLYTPFKYQWIISGDKETVYKTNEQVTRYMTTKFKFPAFNKFLKENYLKFWNPE
jgi:hypothetical protein